ncbi:MAG: methionine--tRNA ligase [Bacillota bacterium]
MSKNSFYITTPIYYPSDNLHIGHAYCTTIADCVARYHRAKGEDVYFVTGTDEHGQKIQRRAIEKGVSPQKFVDDIVEGIHKLWAAMNVSHDDFIRTTEQRHHEVVQYIFDKIYQQGDIYKSAYKGLYCTPCEAFWLERQLVDGKCPDCGRAVESAEEESYFFKLGKYQQRLVEYIETNPEFIRPVTRRNEIMNFIKQGLEDLCVSRTTFDWGVKVPFDDRHVVYVWFDALSNYISALGYPVDKDGLFAKFWPADVHLVGKEITRFHCIIWPCILMALDLPLPKQVYGHGWLLFGDDKMSKSKGNVVDPYVLIEKYGCDALRYFLCREIQLGQDGNFSEEALINRINADLANDLGNLLHRTLNMIEKFNGGIIYGRGEIAELDETLRELTQKTVVNFQTSMDKMDINDALKDVWALISRANKYIDETGPWALAKREDGRSRLNTVLYNLAEVLRIVAVLIQPVMPQTAPKIWQQLGVDGDVTNLLMADTWDGIPAGTRIGAAEALFPRIETESKLSSKDKLSSSQVVQVAVNNSGLRAQDSELKTQDSELSIDEFFKMDLRVAQVLTAEKVAKADKLLKLTVDLGSEQRTVISGIAQYYQPEMLIGKKVVLVANLKPAKIRGVLSHGMILAASTDDNLEIVAAPDLPCGTKIS